MMKNIISQNLKSLFLFGFVASTFGCSTASLVNTLPEQSKEAYRASIAPAIAEAKKRPGANPQTRLRESGKLLLAPVVLYSGPGSREIQSRSGPSHFLPMWYEGGNSAHMQNLVNKITNKIRDDLREKRSVATIVPINLKEMGIEVNGIGSAAAEAGGNTFVSFKYNKWGVDEFYDLTNKHREIGSALFTKINTVWTYKGHSKVNGEAVANYLIYTDLEVKLCVSKTSCTTASIAAGKPVEVLIPLTAKLAVDEKNQASNHEFAYELASDYFSGVVLALFDNITSR
jgi:hypothetical protein